MTEKIKVEVDVSVALALLRNISKSAMQSAWRRTLRKTSNWIKAQAAKAVSSKTQIPQRVLKARIYFFLRDSNTGKVWLGLNPLEADRLGKPRQTKRGVTVARRRFNHAWIMKSSAKAGDWRRIEYRDRNGNRQSRNIRVTQKDVNNRQSRVGKVFERVGRDRNPYRSVKIDWSAEGEAAFRMVSVAAEKRLLELLAQEVNYEILKAKGHA